VVGLFKILILQVSAVVTVAVVRPVLEVDHSKDQAVMAQVVQEVLVSTMTLQDHLLHMVQVVVAGLPTTEQALRYLEVLRVKAVLDMEAQRLAKLEAHFHQPESVVMELQIEAMAVAVVMRLPVVMVVQVLFIFPIQVILHQKVRYVTIQ
jgi:hypothetical protein